MNRRNFLTFAGGMTGYTVMVKVNPLAAATPTTEGHQ
jgi:hypothetical protein